MWQRTAAQCRGVRTVLCIIKSVYVCLLLIKQQLHTTVVLPLVAVGCGVAGLGPRSCAAVLGDSLSPQPVPINSQQSVHNEVLTLTAHPHTH